MNAQVEKYFEPVKQLNALAIENVEKFIDVQLKALKDNTKIGVEQLKSASEIKDVEGLKTYLTNQAEIAKTVSERFVKDAQTAIELGTSYSNEVQNVINDAINTSTTKTATQKKG